MNGAAMEGAKERREYWEKLVTALQAPTATQAAIQARRDATVPVADGIMTPGYQVS